MRLSEFLVRNELTHAEFATKIGVHVTTVYRLCSGLNFPSVPSMKLITAATDGAVTANDFVGIERPEPRTGARGRPRLKTAKK